jgi:hypothetical protein
MLLPLPSVADRSVARRNATAVANELGLRVSARRRIVIGEPDCPYELRWNAPDFWFGIQVSDVSFVVRGNHHRRFAAAETFWVSLKSPSSIMGPNVRVEALSRRLGVDAFASSQVRGTIAIAALSSMEARASLEQLDFGALRHVFLNAVQLYAVSRFVEAPHCVRQSTALRTLLLAVNKWKA